MKRLLPLACLCLVGALPSCTPDIDDTSPAPTGQVIAEFDPAHNIIPTPNDIIPKVDGHLAIPDQATDSDTQKELNAEYLNTLDNFPPESSASLSFSAELDPATVSAKTIIAIDITPPATPAPVAIAPVYANKKISIPAPAGGWLRAHHYAVVAVGGAAGLKGVNGETVVGSTTWALVSGTQKIVNCTDQAKLTGCTVAVDVVPGTGPDLQTQYDTQLASAIQLETIRVQYDLLLSQSSLFGINRDEIPLAFTFTIADAGEMTFDPANSTIPFPNDILRANGQLALPSPKTGKPPTAAECAAATETSVLLVCGLNTLDGWSTTAPPVSENSVTAGALTGGLIDAASLSTTTVGLVPLATTGKQHTAPNYTPCLNCLSSADAAGMVPTAPQQLQWKLNAPLDEKTTYFGYVTSAVKDNKGKPVIASPTFALLRLTKPLIDENNKSTVSLITDAQAVQLEPLRAAFAPIFAGLEAKGIPRLGITLAFPFTTQSEGSVLDQLNAAPTIAGASGLIDYPVAVLDQTAAFNASGAPHDHIAKWFAGQYYSIVAVTNPAGTFNPGLMGAKPQPVNFVMSVPNGPMPTGGWPVTIWGHGINGDKTSFANVANSFAAAGQIMIAPDVLFHGDRTSCTGSKVAIPGATDDAFSCADPATMKCDEGTYGSTTSFGQGLCVLRDDAARPACVISAMDPLGDGGCNAAGKGRCASDGKCQGTGADFLRAGPGTKPVISGWNLFSLTNFFATRDNFRSQVIDLAQLVRIIKSADSKKLSNQLALVNAGAPVPFDTTKLNYAGQSLGGIQGTLFNAVSTDTQNVVLNVPGGNLASIILTAPAFAAQKAALLQVLAGQGLMPGHADFDAFLGLVSTILDPADPANVGYRLTHPVDIGGGVMAPPAARHAFIQFIEGDQTVPNSSNFALVAGANRTFNPAAPPSFGCQAPLYCYEFTAAGEGLTDTTAPLAKRHTFLTTPVTADAFGLALTGKAQTQAATFVTTGNFQ